MNELQEIDAHHYNFDICEQLESDPHNLELCEQINENLIPKCNSLMKNTAYQVNIFYYFIQQMFFNKEFIYRKIKRLQCWHWKNIMRIKVMGFLNIVL